MQQWRRASSGGNSTHLLHHRHNLHPFSSFPYSLTGGDCNFPCKWDCCDERLDVDHVDGGSDGHGHGHGLGASDQIAGCDAKHEWDWRPERRIKLLTSSSSSSSSTPSLSSGTKSTPIGLHDPLVKSTPSCHKLDPTHSSFVKSIMVHMVFRIVDLSGDDDNVDEVLVDVLGGGMVD